MENVNHVVATAKVAQVARKVNSHAGKPKRVKAVKRG